MLLSSIFQDKAYVLPYRSESNKGEIEIIDLLLKSLDQPIHATNIEFISANDDYDIYKFEFNGFDFCIKMSLDAECKKIIHESLYLDSINPIIRPKFIKSGKIKIGDEVSYIITSYENADPIKELGRSFLIENFKQFCTAYSLMQNSDIINVSYQDILFDHFDIADIENNFTEEAIEGIKNYTDFPLIKEILNDMKNELITSYSDTFSEKKYICHGNLNINNIISRNDLFKFINFDNCHSSHCFIDLAELIIELSVPENLEMSMLQDFCEIMNIEFDRTVLKTYKDCYNISLIKKAMELIIAYLKEVYIYNSYRIDKIVQICDKFSQSYYRFIKIKHIANNKDFIIKTLTEPILNSKA